MRKIFFFCLLLAAGLGKRSFAQCGILPSINYSLGTNGQVSFTGAATGATTGTSAFGWNFGDGSGSVGPNVVHNYAANGTFSVLLSVYQTSPNPTCTATLIQTLTVSNYSCILSPNFTINPAGGGTYNFGQTGTGSTHAWDFGDGTVGTNTAYTSHTYSVGGNYTVCHTVGSSCYSTTCQGINANGIPCGADATFTAVPTNTQQVWYFSPNYPWNVSNALWSWGDGTTSNVLYTSHTYSDTGTYSVCLTVTANCGTSTMSCMQQLVNKGGHAATPITIHVVQPQILGVSITEKTDASFSIYPNPGNGSFFIFCPTEPEASIKLFSISGSELKGEFTIIEPGKYQLKTDLPAGMYFVEVLLGDRRSVKKILIEK
jgi:PKD repeat protein